MNKIELDDINISPGHAVAIKAPGLEEYQKSIFIGMKKSEFLIVQVPMTAGIRDRFKLGSTISARFLHEGCVYLFDAKIVDSMARNSYLLFLDYPRKMRRHELRACARISTYIKALAKKGETPQRGVIIDLSAGGCQFIVDASSKLEADNMLDSTIELSFLLTDDGREVHLPSRVVKTKFEGNRVRMGIQFDQTAKGDWEQVARYVNELIEFRNEGGRGADSQD